MSAPKLVVRGLLAAALFSCTGDISKPDSVELAPGEAQPGADPTDPSGPGDPPPPVRCSATPEGCGGFTAPRIRRLTRSEYDATVQALLGTARTPAQSFPTEPRQSGFSRNDAQTVDTVLATALQSAGEALAAEAIVACAPGTPADTCARAFVDSFGARAFRRPLTTVERDGLFAVYQAGAAVDGYASGARQVVRAVLQSPSFLYLTELGLDAYEVAAQLSYLFTGGPPDALLLADAQSGTLLDAEVRKAHARRLLALPEAKRQIELLVVEWLGLDRLETQSKDMALYPDFEAKKPALLAQARSFASDVFFTQKGGVAQLIGPQGVLAMPAFLAAYSNVSDSGPVHRGVAVVRKVLCKPLPDPSELNITVVPPPPDPSLTTRERFAQHTADAACRTCHNLIDPAGFAFEHFDAVGQHRDQDHGKPVDSSGELVFGDVQGPFADHVGLTTKLSASTDVRRCFGDHVYRFGIARTDAASERAFEDVLLDLPEAARGDPLELLVAFAGSDLFVTRRAP